MQALFNRSRRRFLYQAGSGFLAMAAIPAWTRAMEMAGHAMPRRAPHQASPNFKPDVELELVAQPGEVSILPGQATRVIRYVGRLISGPKEAVTHLPDCFLGPLLRFNKGQKVRIHLRNELSERTITHWHGLHVPAEMDGHPMYELDRGQTFVYEFEIVNRAALTLYHTHAHELTGKQVYQGLAGGLIVEDDEERRLELPSGEYEIPIVIQDRSFDTQNQLVYLRHMMDRMTGFYGDRILVNGRPDFALDVATRAYRFRVVNGSNARIYKLGWSDGTPLTILGVDGGLLERPETYPYAMLGPGERIDLWADFSGRPVGGELALRSLPFSGALPMMMERMMGRGRGGSMTDEGHGGMGMGGMGGMGGGMMGRMGSALPMGSDYSIFRVKFARKTDESQTLPVRLSTLDRLRVEDAANPGKPVPMGISEGHMSMLLNGRPYAHNDFQPNERIPFDTVQLMEIFHAHGEGGGHGGGGDTRGEHGGSQASPGERRETAETGGGMGHGMMGGMGSGMGHGMMGGMGGGMGHGMMGGGMKEDAGEGRMGGMEGMGGMGDMGMMMSMAHPIHIHGGPFQILSRTISGDEAGDYATVREGFIDSGWKDTVLIMPGEKVRILKPFKDYKGVFMFHCHNLEHEDLGMMREFLVE